MSIYDSLNPQQKEAVLHDKGPLLILAGAGSGKTRVLTHRIAYLIEERNVNPWNILAITFTNKAAKEMRERVDSLIGYGAEDVWVSTFHSTCVRILRRYIESIGYSKNFTIYDADDQKTLMRDVCKYLNIDTKAYKEKSILSVISNAKNELINSVEFAKDSGNDYSAKIYSKAYTEYQKRLKSNNALDFDDLIFKTIDLFKTNDEALAYFQNRFKYIMVDEYQDTNTAQFQLIYLLSSGINRDGVKENNLSVVGDDDQSIYKFRGANIHNILNFEKAYRNTKVIKLEQNYRSTKNILNAANEVILNNTTRKVKSLWTDNDEGEPLNFTVYSNDLEEAESIADSIQTSYQKGDAKLSDFAILYRTNAQSRVIEDRLVRKNIPYKIIGGVNFYARKEIKDIIAYLKTIDNGLDDIAVKRILNVPRRGIGLTTSERVETYSINNEISFYEALKNAEYVPGLERTSSRIVPFISLIEGLKNNLQSESFSLSDIIDDILDGTGYLKELETEGSDEALERINNINELINTMTYYEQNAEQPTLSGFLEEVALISAIDNLDDTADYVVLMTLHSSKGLEFPHVYLCGMEEGIFPSYMIKNADNPKEELEEERRLCYVGITRAKTTLSLSAARQRMLRGEMQYNKPSRFVYEIPRHLLKSELPNNKVESFNKKNSFGINTSFTAKPFSTLSKNIGGNNLLALDYETGDTVKHIKFGEGLVIDITKGGKDYEITVEFKKFGVKKLISSFAKLKKIE
ncbi:MAG TPA: UvrD-helicase domain-containing protein [Clostridiales bacterium]|nr:UvrD-helicase domain-containing protein [Clostridiales bacterium]